MTALASDPQANLDFYTGVLGLRLVKQTVNFDAPDVYHLYYGDAQGSPGSILTFFPFVNAAPGRRGTGEISAVRFSIPPDSLGFWISRFAQYDVPMKGPETQFGEEVLTCEDPDGLQIELLEDEGAEVAGHSGSRIPPEYILQRICGVTIVERELSPTARFLSSIPGILPGTSGANLHRFSTGDGPARSVVDILVQPDEDEGVQSAGSVHHIAWRAHTAAEQLEWREQIVATGTPVTQVLDRKYFRSIYFREPGGVLCEIATDSPGFTVDEPGDSLGRRLMLPSWLESERQRLERILPPLRQSPR